jgi:hypothetical protein
VRLNTRGITFAVIAALAFAGVASAKSLSNRTIATRETKRMKPLLEKHGLDIESRSSNRDKNYVYVDSRVFAKSTGKTVAPTFAIVDHRTGKRTGVSANQVGARVKKELRQRGLISKQAKVTWGDPPFTASGGLRFFVKEPGQSMYSIIVYKAAKSADARIVRDKYDGAKPL